MKIDFKKDFSSFQDGARRMETAMNGTPDRVPVCAQMHEFVMKELGVNARGILYHAETFARRHP